MILGKMIKHFKSEVGRLLKYSKTYIRKVLLNLSSIFHPWHCLSYLDPLLPKSTLSGSCRTTMDNKQQIADAVQKGLQLIVRASVQQGSTRLRRLRIELCSDSFHAVLALSCGRAKFQCCVTTVTVVVYYRSSCDPNIVAW